MLKPFLESATVRAFRSVYFSRLNNRHVGFYPTNVRRTALRNPGNKNSPTLCVFGNRPRTRIKKRYIFYKKKKRRYKTCKKKRRCTIYDTVAAVAAAAVMAAAQTKGNGRGDKINRPEIMCNFR